MYTQTAPGGGAAHAGRSPAASAVNFTGTPCFLHTASTSSFVSKDDAMCSAANPCSGETSATGLVAPGEKKAAASIISTEDEGEGQEDDGILVFVCVGTTHQEIVQHNIYISLSPF